MKFHSSTLYGKLVSRQWAVQWLLFPRKVWFDSVGERGHVGPPLWFPDRCCCMLHACTCACMSALVAYMHTACIDTHTVSYINLPRERPCHLTDAYLYRAPAT